MIVLFTDFGWQGPYMGQMEAVLRRRAPGTDIVTLMADAPPHDPQSAAYLLPAYTAGFPEGTVFLCVVDPGVGGDRAPGILQADGHWFVGPDNGLFELVARRATAQIRWWEITWRPERLSATFHGRDLFAPVAGLIAAAGDPDPDVARPAAAAAMRRTDWPDDLARVVYIDHFGNAVIGMRRAAITGTPAIEAGGHVLTSARTFSDVPTGRAFWYENADGLVEIAVNGGRADTGLGLTIGSAISIS